MAWSGTTALKKIAKTLEEMFLADFIEIGFAAYSLMTDVRSKHIAIEDCVASNRKIKLIWNYAKTPDILMT